MAGRAGGQGPGEQVCRPQLRILCVLLLSLGFCRSVPSGEAQPNACLVGSALLGKHEGSLNCPTQALEGKLRHCTQSQRPVSQTLESLEWSGRIKAVLNKKIHSLISPGCKNLSTKGTGSHGSLHPSLPTSLAPYCSVHNSLLWVPPTCAFKSPCFLPTI